jgi:hypothetical protein
VLYRRRACLARVSVGLVLSTAVVATAGRHRRRLGQGVAFQNLHTRRSGKTLQQRDRQRRRAGQGGGQAGEVVDPQS